MMRLLAIWIGFFPLLAACSSDTTDLRFEVQSQGAEVLDKVTGLTWQMCPQGMGSVWPARPEQACLGTADTYTWDAALARAQVVAGQSGKAWRLPTVQELSSLPTDAAHGPSWAKQPFPAHLMLVNSDRISTYVSPNFWSSNAYDSDIARNSIWFVSLGTGFTSNQPPIQKMYLRLVR